MLELDGASAGGQYVRSALTLSILTETPIAVTNVRGSRPEPGLRPQHCAAVAAAAAVCDATVEGAGEGSESFTFEPGSPTGGVVDVEIGTAGSLTLLFDTLCPLAVALPAPLEVRATGGTDVKWAPPATTYRRVKLPLLRRLGVQAAVDVDRRGFYPVGGGRATLFLAPSDPPALALGERGASEGVRVYSIASVGLADADVAERQATAAADRLEAAGHELLERTVEYVDSASPGTVCTVRADYANALAGFDALGEKGKPAEEVGEEAAAAAVDFAVTDAAVDRHLADQLLVFLAVAGGRVAVPAVTDHVRSSLELLAEFEYDLALERAGETPVVLGPDRV